MPWGEYVARSLAEWRALLDSDPAEREVQKWLELHPAFLPGGVGDVGPGGHHGSEWNAVFREVPLKGLGKNRQPDFMWVTRSSSLVTPILIEIEKPNAKWLKANGRPTRHMLDALDQLTDWKVWFSRPENQTIFRQTYIFDDDFKSRALEAHYVLIYGRESEFKKGGGHDDPDWLRYKRDFMRREREQFMTFDSLKPDSHNEDAVTVSMTTDGAELWAVAPTFGTGPAWRDAAVELLGVEDAIDRSAYIEEHRRDYLKGRVDFWRKAAANERKTVVTDTHSLGRE